MQKIISFMLLSLDGFVTGPNEEMNWIKGDEEIFDHAGKWISEEEISLFHRFVFISRKDAKEQRRKGFLGVLVLNFAALREQSKMY